MKNLKLAFVALAVSSFMYGCGSSDAPTEQTYDTSGATMEEEEPMRDGEAQPVMASTEMQSAGTAGAASASITTPPTGAATVAKEEAQQPAAAAPQQQAPAAATKPATPAAKPAAGTDPALIAQGKTLVENSDCRACHAVDSKLVGPSFQEIAQRYQKDPKAVDLLSGKIIEGGAGNWGQIPMSPHPQISKADASKMVQYVLSLK